MDQVLNLLQVNKQSQRNLRLQEMLMAKRRRKRRLARLKRRRKPRSLKKRLKRSPLN